MLAEISSQGRDLWGPGPTDAGHRPAASREHGIRVRLHTRNPFAWVSAVRLALRLSHADGAEIDRFSEEALRRREPGRMRDVCGDWASIEVVT